MNVISDIKTETARGVSITCTPEGLSAIQRPNCAAVIWQRDPLAGFQSWINGLEPEQLPKTRLVLRSGAVRQAVVEACRAAGTPDCAERDLLVDDVAALADMFTSLTQADCVQLRLDVVSTNACRTFHVDAVTPRLVCTYRGSGTQYGNAPKGSDPDQIWSVPAASPMIRRGTLQPEFPKSELLHRSPPIEGSGETRLLLVLDPITNPEEHAERMQMH